MDNSAKFHHVLVRELQGLTGALRQSQRGLARRVRRCLAGKRRGDADCRVQVAAVPAVNGGDLRDFGHGAYGDQRAADGNEYRWQVSAICIICQEYAKQRSVRAVIRKQHTLRRRQHAADDGLSSKTQLFQFVFVRLQRQFTNNFWRLTDHVQVSNARQSTACLLRPFCKLLAVWSDQRQFQVISGTPGRRSARQLRDATAHSGELVFPEGRE